MSAVIPVGQFANIQPTIEVEAENHEAAATLALERIQKIWDRVGEKPLRTDRDKAQLPVGELKHCWASGTEIYFDPIEHVYRDAQGIRYLGGSTFAHRYAKEFPGATVAGKMATKYEVDADEVQDMWALNSLASTTVGTAVHAALELRQRYSTLSQQVKDGSFESALTKNPILRPIVDAFFTEERQAEEALAEILVADPIRHHAGQIDRTVILAPKRVRLEDHKTSRDVFKAESILPPFKDLVPANQLGLFTLQLNFYRRILESHGVTVEGLRVNHWDGSEWVVYDLELLDLDAIMKAAKDESCRTALDRRSKTRGRGTSGFPLPHPW